MTMQELLQLQNKLIQKNSESVGDLTKSNTSLAKEVKGFSGQFKAANQDSIRNTRETTKISDDLNNSLKGLQEVIKENIAKFIKAGGGESLGNKIAGISGANEAGTQENSKLTLRKVLFGETSKEEINKGSFFGIGKKLNRAVEKKEFRDAAKESDRGTISTGNLPNNDTRGFLAKKFGLGKTLQDKKADRMFEEKKAEEDRLAEIQMKLNRAEEAGLTPLKKDIAERDNAATAVIEKTPALKAKFAPEEETKSKKAKVEKQEKEETKSKKAKSEKANNNDEHQSAKIIPFPTKGEKAEDGEKKSIDAANTMEKESESAALKENTDKQVLSTEHAMGTTLGDSLVVHKQNLEVLTKMSKQLDELIDKDGEDSGGSSILSKAGNLLKKGAPLAAEAAVPELAAATGALGTAATIGTVAVGGAAATGLATGLLASDNQKAHREAYSAKNDPNGMLGAMSGDTAMAANILEANGDKTPEQIKAEQAKEQNSLKDAPWYTRIYGINKDKYLKNQPTVESKNMDPVVELASKKNAEIKSETENTSNGANTVVSAPTNNIINNSNSNAPSRSPIRNQDSTAAKYIESRYA
jgi:hypothetical protein